VFEEITQFLVNHAVESVVAGALIAMLFGLLDSAKQTAR
jgi:VanZ family protein